MKTLRLLCALLLFNYTLVNAQSSNLKIAVVAPLYLDSLFDESGTIKNNLSFPKYVLPGLDFYHGVQLAVDSLNAAGKHAEVYLYDSKGKTPLSKIVATDSFNRVSMIIAVFNNRTDAKYLAAIAQARSIPLISATYPNDAGVVDNPFFIMINSGLKTHCEAIYQYVQKNYASPSNNLIYIKGFGAVEDMIESYFKNMATAAGKAALKWKTLPLTDTFSAHQLYSKLDSNKSNILICGDLHENFGIRLVRTLAAAKSYQCTVLGMPTWDGLKELDKPEYKDVEIIYSTPYNYPKSLPLIKQITQQYNNKLNARPTDMVFKGYEAVLRFVPLLLDKGVKTLNYLSDKSYKVFNDFEFVPVKNPNEGIDYLENKKLYFIKK